MDTRTSINKSSLKRILFFVSLISLYIWCAQTIMLSKHIYDAGDSQTIIPLIKLTNISLDQLNEAKTHTSATLKKYQDYSRMRFTIL